MTAPTLLNPGYAPEFPLYDPVGHGIDVFLQAGTLAQDATTGIWYAPLAISGSISATNPSVGTDGSAIPTSSTLIGASDGTNLQQLLVESASNRNLRIGIYQAGNEASIGAFHNSDAQMFSAITNVLATGGSVPYLYNPSGLADRQRAIGIDGIPAMGISTSGQQLAGPALTTTFNGAVTGSALAQSVAVGSSANVSIGDIITTQDNVEQVEITAKADATHVTGIFKNNHANGQTLTWYHYNQARDATIGDQVGGTGVSPSATYLYNNIAGNFELDRSANGELDGASGQGTAVAAEYEFNGNMPANGGTLSGLRFDRARNLGAKGLGSGTLANNPLAANSTTLTLNAAPTTLEKGMLILIDRAGASPELNVVGTGYTFGSTSVPLQIATINSHALNATVEWDQSAALGPGLSGFLPFGLGVEEEAIYNAVDGKMYIQRSATADAMAGANLPAESVGLYNGATFDRWASDATGKGKVSLYMQNSVPGDTVITGNAAGGMNVQPQVSQAAISKSNPMPVAPGTPIGTQVDQSASGTNATVTATMSAVAAKSNYLTGYEITALPGTALTSADVTISGLQNTLTAEFADPVGDTGKLIVTFNPPRQASAVNTAVSVSVAALGANSGKVSVNVHGYNY